MSTAIRCPEEPGSLRTIFNAIKVKLELNYNISHWLLIKLTHSWDFHRTDVVTLLHRTQNLIPNFLPEQNKPLLKTIAQMPGILAEFNLVKL